MRGVWSRSYSWLGFPMGSSAGSAPSASTACSSTSGMSGFTETLEAGLLREPTVVGVVESGQRKQARPIASG